MDGPTSRERTGRRLRVRPSNGNQNTVTNQYMFTCPECGQEIEVNASMREAILSSGCPVCTGSVEDGCFEAVDA